MLTVQRSAVIANGQSLSAAFDLGDCSPILLQMPATWTAADLTLQCAADGTNFGNVYDKDGNEYTIKAAASAVIILDLADMLGLGLLKLRSGTAGTPVNQAAERTITVIGRAVE
jgi:hypothetical protein